MCTVPVPVTDETGTGTGLMFNLIYIFADSHVLPKAGLANAIINHNPHTQAFASAL